MNNLSRAILAAVAVFVLLLAGTLFARSRTAVEEVPHPAPTRADLLVDHPFNTYRRRGLPPGPIASPGRAAIEAVLAPARVPYLYFVSIDARQHHFSVTLEEHQEAVARYRQARARVRPL